jgi:serine/threonine protein kinase
MFESSFLNNQENNLQQNKMENEFILIKTIKELNLDCIYKVKEKKTNKIFCIKKIRKNSQKNNVNNLQKLFNDMKNKNIIPGLKEESLLGSFFCNHYIDFWVEEENYDLNENFYMPEKYLYILYPFYSNGDLLDYLQKLEKKPNKKFTPDFYWDIIFEMIMGVKYFHELGYLHLDIKPTNFLVDENGYIKLTDFGLCHKISEIPFITDIIEGDFTYISKELFNFNSDRILTTKADIFSLGLSILEIVGKIILPSSGESWMELRSGNFEIKENLFNNSYIKDKKEDFIKLITKMIAPINERPDLNQLINDIQELKNRYISLKNNVYKKSLVI